MRIITRIPCVILSQDLNLDNRLEPQDQADLTVRYVSEIVERLEQGVYQINITVTGGREL